ncbi:hypothetical protein GCM10007937_26180 [Mesorhizobium albiziae]|nr:hypothetical protein GCM10007937_26180 [Mesorhizobium albiziae]
MALAAPLQARSRNGLIARGLGFGLSAARWLQRRAALRLIDAVPANSEEATEKLNYIMAFLIADGTDVHPEDIDKVIHTLRRTRFDAKAHLDRNVSSQNAQTSLPDETWPPLAGTGRWNGEQKGYL